MSINDLGFTPIHLTPLAPPGAHEAVARMRRVETMAKIDAMHATDARLQQILKPINR